MNIHEFGQENRECVLFLHASCTGWEFYEESIRLLELAYPPEKYGAEDLDWMERMLKHMSARTIWRVFDSCNNYSMPNTRCSIRLNLLSG